jgi:ribosome maturation factor RimP
MDLKGNIEDLAASNLENKDLFIVDILITGTSGMKKITVLLDGDKGVTIEDCARLSRKLGDLLEEKELIDSAYVLEVSSPGLDQPLKLKRQYVKNIGRRLKVMLNDQKIKTGKLEEIKEDSILLSEEVKQKGPDGKPGKKIKLIQVEIPFTEIKKSSVLIAFN